MKIEHHGHLSRDLIAIKTLEQYGEREPSPESAGDNDYIPYGRDKGKRYSTTIVRFNPKSSTLRVMSFQIRGECRFPNPITRFHLPRSHPFMPVRGKQAGQVTSFPF